MSDMQDTENADKAEEETSKYIKAMWGIIIAYLYNRENDEYHSNIRTSTHQQKLLVMYQILSNQQSESLE